MIDLEEIVEDFITAHQDFQQHPLHLDAMVRLLTEKYGYTIDEHTLGDYPELEGLRSVLIPGPAKNCCSTSTSIIPRKCLPWGGKLVTAI
ncbi:MAG: hypothetical protein HC880_22220 [Bacteroidia bacterium]|nr:hypothetical protein [Bacteroidia bacterium]